MRTTNLVTGCVAIIAMFVVGAMALKTNRDLRFIEAYRTEEAVKRAIVANGEDAIIIFGDSIVRMAPLPLQACGVPIVNAGIGGVRASMLIPLLETMAAMPVHPRRIVIVVGVNDSAVKFWHEASFAATYEALLLLAVSISPTVVATVAPVDTRMNVGMTLSHRARDHINETIIATATKLSLKIIKLDDLPWRTIDGVHPYPSDYEGWVSRVMGTLCD